MEHAIVGCDDQHLAPEAVLLCEVAVALVVLNKELRTGWAGHHHWLCMEVVTKNELDAAPRIGSVQKRDLEGVREIEDAVGSRPRKLLGRNVTSDKRYIQTSPKILLYR
jgi:hypothetical protein